jgi:hypothetical protein
MRASGVQSERLGRFANVGIEKTIPFTKNRKHGRWLQAVLESKLFLHF